MLTPWGEQVDPTAVLPEYPRPQLVRDSYLNLNGWWDHAVRPVTSPGPPASWDGPILVPFSPESPLSGVERTLMPDEFLWYRRTFTLPDGFVRGRVLLRFGAVDQDCVVWVDGVEVGGHEGGYLPFGLDITEALRSGMAERQGLGELPRLEPGDHDLLVRVRDVTDTSWRSRGKQRLEPGGIWYSAHSGIWQTVWVESVPAQWIEAVELVPHLSGSAPVGLEVRVRAGGGGGGGVGRGRVPGRGVGDDAAGRSALSSATVTVRSGGNEVVSAVVPVGDSVLLPMPEARLWSPDDPFLHDVEVTLGEDRVSSYVGMRSVGVGPDAAGRTRLLLNGRPYLHAGLLDQGYWPDGLCTAPSDDALVHDIRTAKDLGFTMLRKHVKVEPLRWYHHCDRLGMLVWQDFVNGGGPYRSAVVSAPAVLPVRLDDSHHGRFGRADAAGREEFRREARATVDLLRNAPSVVAWVPFNEGWGQFDANALAAEVRRLDPTRVIDHASGWHDQGGGGGDVVSRHVYLRPYRLSRADAAEARAAVLSEYGGYSYRVSGHTWSGKSFGYKRIRSRDGLTRELTRLHREQVVPAVRDGLAGFVYTQLTDVEEETNGLLTYDRRVVKVDRDAVRSVNERLRVVHDAAALGTPLRPVRVVEREITRPVGLTRPDGRLNPDAVGWTRTPMHTADGIGHGWRGLGRNKRWEYWAVTTPTHVVALTVSDIDYASVNGIWVLDRRTRTEFAHAAIGPLGRGSSLPGTLGRGPARARSRGLAIDVEEVAGGTLLRCEGARIRMVVVATRPEGHECLGVVVPWSDRLFQYTVKDVARPVTGRITVDGADVPVPEGDSWATLDHGRGRWPHTVWWNWGAGSGRTDGHVVGVQVGGQWTDGTGSVENSLLVDTHLTKISEELVWDHDTDDWMRPWRVSGESVELTLTPEYVKHVATDFKVISSRTHQAFGTWSGRVRDDRGGSVRVADVFGWAEDVHQRW